MGLDMSDDYPYGYIPLSGETLSAGKSAETGGEDAAPPPPDLNESFAVGPWTVSYTHLTLPTTPYV